METYSLGSVNVDSLKESLLFLASVYPFVDEAAKDAFTTQVNGLDSAGNPNEGVVEQIHATETPAAEAPATTEEVIPTDSGATEATVAEPPAETPAENATQVPDGAAVSNAATANESNAAPVDPEETPDQKIARLESELADAQAAATQTPASAE